jgi:hypothetical protein
MDRSIAIDALDMTAVADSGEVGRSAVYRRCTSGSLGYARMHGGEFCVFTFNRLREESAMQVAFYD